MKTFKEYLAVTPWAAKLLNLDITKEELKKAIINAKDKIPDMTQIGNEIERIVIWVNDKKYKITTAGFQASKKAEKKQ
jgi:hypothetical protein